MKNTCTAGVESKGFCFYKATNGIKRHLAVDTLGFPFFVHCTQANLSDDQGLIAMLTANIEYFKARPDDLPKLTILVKVAARISAPFVELPGLREAVGVAYE